MSISIHALREESDLVKCSQLDILDLFQSTLSARRATRGGWCYVVKGKEFQSTLSARRATGIVLELLAAHMISIHALREESDSVNSNLRHCPMPFQSTLSVRRATYGFV